MPKTGKKRGRPAKIGDEQRAKVLGVVGAGGSIPDAAGIIEVGVRTLQRAMREDRHFGTGVKKARKSAKMRLIQKVTSAKAWQAAAWMLERMYGAEFGRKEKHEHTGKDGAPIETKTTHTLDLSKLSTDELRMYRTLNAKASADPARN